MEDDQGQIHPREEAVSAAEGRRRPAPAFLAAQRKPVVSGRSRQKEEASR